MTTYDINLAMMQGGGSIHWQFCASSAQYSFYWAKISFSFQAHDSKYGFCPDYLDSKPGYATYKAGDGSIICEMRIVSPHNCESLNEYL